MLNSKDKVDWFKDWFNSPYYHILYKNRDLKEADNFIKNLIQFLKPKSSSKFIDIACGKGRHAIFINKLGFNVDAFDLSKNSIDVAKLSENKNLRFYVNDIRNSLNKNYYDFGLNLFTSFGYFKDESDNYKAMQAISDSLKIKGILVIDFMNTHKIIKELVKNETKIINNISFNINRKVENGFILKDIFFEDKSKKFNFQEKVKELYLSDFKSYLHKAGLEITHVFGDYQLSNFDIENSDRKILIAQKIK